MAPGVGTKSAAGLSRVIIALGALKAPPHPVIRLNAAMEKITKRGVAAKV